MFHLQTLFAVLVATFVARSGAISVATPPSVSVCVPAQITWTDASDGTIYLSIQSSGGWQRSDAALREKLTSSLHSIARLADPNGAAIEQLNTTSGSAGTYIWPVNVEANQSIQYKVTDSSGAYSFSNVINVNDSTDKSCLSSTSSSSGTTTTSSSSGSTSKTSTTPATTSSGNTSTSTSSPSTGTSSSGTGTTSTSSTTTQKTGTTSGTTSTNTTSTGSKAANSARAVVLSTDSWILATTLAGPMALSLILALV